MMRVLLCAFLLPLAAQAQLVLSVVDGATETALVANSVFQLRPTETGDTQSVRLRVRNAGQQPAEITRFVADGSGFSLNRPLPPITLAAGGSLNATLTFVAGAPANYSANLQLNGISVLVLVSVTAGPTLTVFPTCNGTLPNTLEFGTVPRGQSRLCEFSLSNPTAQAMNISTVTVSGVGFSFLRTTTAVTLAAGQSTSFAVQLTPQTVGVITGMLKIQGREYILRATVVEAPLPAPIFEFESSAAASGQQRRLTVRLPAPSPTTTTGLVNLAFIADPNLADDPAVMFVETSSRQVRFAVEEGKSTVTLNGQAFATFQTGTTVGRIRFTLSGVASGFASDPETTVILSPTPIALDKVLPSRFPDRIELVLTGFDNTFSIGSMLFRFFDSAGQQLAAIPADFTAALRAFYAGSPGGSAFKITIKFPVAGSSATVAGIEADLSNSAGTVRTARLPF